MMRLEDGDVSSAVVCCFYYGYDPGTPHFRREKHASVICSAIIGLYNESMGGADVCG